MKRTVRRSHMNCSNADVHDDAHYMIKESLKAVMPDAAVRRALENKDFGNGKVVLIAAGKAAWQMADTAHQVLGDRVCSGLVITKYGSSCGQIGDYTCIEAGHPVPDKNSFKGAGLALDAVSGLCAEDTVLFLLSGGGSALFEKPSVTQEELQDITCRLLGCGADIREINTVRKHISQVKGGRFAQACSPARVYSIVLSDIIGDPLGMIASGPAYPDASTSADAFGVLEKYDIIVNSHVRKCIEKETPKALDNVETVVTGSVRELCSAAKKAAEACGYETVMLTDRLDCMAREAGTMLGDIALSHQETEKSIAFIAGGETVVRLTGDGKGGRNQEIALAAADKIVGCRDTVIFSIGSDGSDGPTDAAGGIADGMTGEKLASAGIDIFSSLQKNDSYNALKECRGLIKTGPTGTNVNDLAAVLIKR